MIDALKHWMQPIWRRRRMQAFLDLVHPKSGIRVIDLGGTPELWEMLDIKMDITLVNQSGSFGKCFGPFKHQYQFIKADACEMTNFPDKSFDLVFSNSVIEHVGPPNRQEAFAKTVHRLAPSYWIQTPSPWFPLEAHCNLPFWWFYPPCLKQAWIYRWQRRGQEFRWKQMLETRVLSLSQLESLFPEAQVFTEYVFGFPKSYSLYKAVSR